MSDSCPVKRDGSLVKVNKAQWESVPAQERERIIEGLISVGALVPGDKIIGDDTMPPFTEESVIELCWNPLKEPCKIACDAAAGAAFAWCTVNTAGAALVACYAAAEAGRNLCRDKC